jgi:hypothetical protein
MGDEIICEVIVELAAEEASAMAAHAFSLGTR